MSERVEVEIVRLEDREGPIEKKPDTYGSGHHYEVPVVEVLADGRRLDTVDRHQRLRDAKAFRKKLPEVPSERIRRFAKFNEQGERVGTVTAYWIGPR